MHSCLFRFCHASLTATIPCPPPVQVTMSNWEARQLSARQMQYAALDAIITGHVYRGLRLWHASPSACTSCRQLLGAVSAACCLCCPACCRSC